MLPLYLTAILTAGLFSLVGSASVGDVFRIELSSNDAGGCGWMGQTAMDDIYSECITLAETGEKLVDDYDNVPEAARLLDAFFNQGKTRLTQGQRTKIKDRFTSVSNWLKNGGPVNGGRSGEKPFLFCHHTWLSKQAMDDVAREKDGTDVKYTDPDGSERIVAIGDVTAYQKAQKDEEQALRAGGVTNPTVVPYWSLKHNSYIFDSWYGGKGRGYCSDQGSRAATQHVTSSSSITLCPKSFGTDNRALSNKNVVKLRSKGLQPTKRSSLSGSQEIKELLPTSVNLFHEVFHLVLGNDVTYPTVGEIYVVSDMLSTQFDESLVNPETFATVAVGYDYTSHSGQDKDGWRVEFCTGYTTQG